MRAVRCVSAVLLLCAMAFAQAEWKVPSRDASALVEPKNLVRRYCQMDQEGFRLDSRLAPRLQALTTWEKVPDWSGVDVITGFEVMSAKQSARGVVVTVSYTVVGHFETRVGYTPGPRMNTVEFETVEQNGVLKIVDGDGMRRPRVSRMRLTRWIREQSAKEKDPEVKKVLDVSAQQLSDESW